MPAVECGSRAGLASWSRRVNRELAAQDVCLGQRKQVLDRLDLVPLEHQRMDPEAPLQLRHQAKTVGLTIHLQVPAEANRAAEVAAGAECDFR